MTPPPNKPEPESLWETWKTDPTPDNLLATVKSLEPTIQVSLQTVGGGGDPYLKSKARSLAAKAVQTYDPASGAQLKTWTSQQMMRLRRLKRQSANPVRIPERIQIENYTLSQATARFVDDNDREPTVQELADATNLPIKRIAHIRQSLRAMPSEADFADSELPGQSSQGPQYLDEAVSMVYDDVDTVDRRILELKTGYGGEVIMQPADIARRLKLTPSQLSRRSTKLALQIQKAEADLEGLL